MMDEIARRSLLMDFYGVLLTERQQDVLRLYHEENLSLSEIAEDFGITRQGVHDTLKTAEHGLLEYEEKLGLVDKMQKMETTAAQVVETVATLLAQHRSEPDIAAGLETILSEMKQLIE